MPDTADTSAGLPAERPADLNEELMELVRRHRNAAGVGMELLNALGSQASNLLDRIPEGVRGQLESTTKAALEVSFTAAALSRRGVPDGADWLNTALTTAMGAAGGFGGLPSALAEIPVTTTVLMRAIQGIAEDEGFDPKSEETRLRCLEVFAAAGPLQGDEKSESGFLTLRIAVSGPGLKAIIGQVTPIFAQVLGRKIAAQAVPVLGAVAGAATNYVYTSYYQDMARVQFGLQRIARERGLDHEALVRDFVSMLEDDRKLGRR